MTAKTAQRNSQRGSARPPRNTRGRTLLQGLARVRHGRSAPQRHDHTVTPRAKPKGQAVTEKASESRSRRYQLGKDLRQRWRMQGPNASAAGSWRASRGRFVRGEASSARQPQAYANAGIHRSTAHDKSYIGRRSTFCGFLSVPNRPSPGLSADMATSDGATILGTAQQIERSLLSLPLLRLVVWIPASGSLLVWPLCASVCNSVIRLVKIWFSLVVATQ